MDLTGKYIKGTGSYEVKEIAPAYPAWVDTGGVDYTANYSTKDLSKSFEGSFHRFTYNGSTTHLYRAFPITTGRSYVLRFKFRIPVGAHGSFSVAARASAGGSGTQTIAGIVIPVDGQWYEYEYIFVATADNNGINWYDNAQMASGDYYDVAYLTIEELPEGYPLMDAGKPYLQCDSAGSVAFPSKQAYGEWEFDLFKFDDNNSAFIIPWAITADSVTNAQYNFRFSGNNSIVLREVSTELMSSDDDYIEPSVWYRIKITRALDGEFTVYVKGGAFGVSDWTLVSTSGAGGAGTNPATDNTYTAAKYFTINLDLGDRIANIVMRPAVKQ